MRELKIKTKVVSVADYLTINLDKWLPEFKADNEKIDKDIKRIQYSNGSKNEAETVLKGDLVLISCHSENPHYQKDDIYLIVEKNLYSAELEEKLVGLPKGESKLEIENTEVIVNIKSIIRTEIPDLTDDNVKSWGLENITNIEELKKYYFNRQIDAFRDDSEEADTVVTLLCNEVLENGVFELDESEELAIKKTVDIQIEKAKELQKELIESGEEIDTSFDMVSLAKQMASQTLKAASVGYKMLSEEGFVLNTDHYQDELTNRAELLHITTEELAKEYSETDYSIEYYAQHFFDTLEKYVGDYMKKYYYTAYKKKVDIYDVAIVGAGPAGLSAALTLNVHNKSIIWFGSDTLSDKVEKSEKIVNYAGFEEISGKELNDRLRNQMKYNHLELTDKMVTQINKYKDYFMVLADNQIYKAKTVLMTIGAVSPKGIPNEQELLGRGVSYCATCDGFLYKGKEIAVFCGNERYEHEVEYLAELVDKVYLYTPYETKLNISNVDILSKPIKSVTGENKVDGIELTDGTRIPVSGVFFLRNSVAPAMILKGLEMDGPHIVVNRNCETNIEGCFAAGDCTGRPYQIAKAVGEGNVAAHNIIEKI